MLITGKDQRMESVLNINDHNPCLETIIESSISSIIEALGEDLKRDGLKSTPIRVRKTLQFLTKGYTEDPVKIVNGALFASDAEDMVVVRNINFFSLCEHHMLPFFGKCHIAYLPNRKILGLSKFPRIVEIFARRLQIQEHLTNQVAECIMQVTQAKGVAVWIEAQHLCLMIRGVEKQLSDTITLSKVGLFQSCPTLYEQFLNIVKGPYK